MITFNNKVVTYNHKWINDSGTPGSDHYHYEIYISAPNSSRNISLYLTECVRNNTHVYKEYDGVWYDDTTWHAYPVGWPMVEGWDPYPRPWPHPMECEKRIYNFSGTEGNLSFKVETDYPKGYVYYQFVLEDIGGSSVTIGDVSIRAVETFSGITVYNQTITINGSSYIRIPEP